MSDAESHADANRQLVDRGDLDEILRHIDRLCDERAWDALNDLRGRCLRAFERGHQLWPAASNAEYRIALDGPAELACRIVEDAELGFSLGPLTEVVAQNHPWADLEPHLQADPLRSVVATERVLRGDSVPADHVDTRVLGLPSTLAEWEQSLLAKYTPYGAEFAAPAPVALTAGSLPEPGDIQPDDDVIEALRTLVAAWTQQSMGVISAVVVEGTAESAIAALGLPSARWAEGTLSSAAAVMQWAASSGGANGRRRGAAAGRFDTWWAIAALTNLLDDWPLSIDEITVAGTELRWVHFHDAGPSTGWGLHLAIEDPGDGLAWAIAAADIKAPDIQA